MIDLLKSFKTLWAIIGSILLVGCNPSPQHKDGVETTIASKKPQITTKNKKPPPTPWSYAVIQRRDFNYQLTNPTLQGKINNWLMAQQGFDLTKLIDFLLEVTHAHLVFSFKHNSNNPNELVNTKKANCVGYASFYAALFRYTVYQQRLTQRFRCHQAIGQIYYQNQDVHRFFNNPFFANHDFNVIEDTKTKQRIAIDPSFYAYLGVKRIELRGK